MTELAVVEVKNGVIDNVHHWRIKTPPEYMNEFPENLDSDFLPAIWKEASLLFSEYEFATAFNLTVHKSNLEKSLSHYGLPLPNIHYVCAYNWAKEVMPLATNFNAAVECFGLKISDNENTHISQALATSELVIKLTNQTGISIADRWVSLPAKKANVFKAIFNMEEANLEGLVWMNPEDITSEFWLGKIFVVTGEFEHFPDRKKLIAQIEQKGAKSVGSISGKTNIVVIGNGAGPSKVDKIREIQMSGKSICLLNEASILKCI